MIPPTDCGADDVYFRDLTAYSYLRTGEGDQRALNIGWLATGEPFETGYVAPPVLDELKRLAKAPSHLTRGYHFCEWCVQALRSPGGSPVDPRTFAEDLRAIGALGNGEIAVRAPDGVRYVAPVMICHYIEMHGYLPPQVFVEAVAGALDHAVNLLLGPSTRGLVDVCPPSGAGQWDIDWPGFEARLGTPVPDDYRELVSAYGPGRFLRFVSVYRPEAGSSTALLERMQHDVLRAMGELRRDGLDIPYDLERLLPCGVTDDGEHLFWRTGAPDPNAWRIVVSVATFDDWFEFDGGLAEFLRAVLTGSRTVPFFPDGLLAPAGPCFEPRRHAG